MKNIMIKKYKGQCPFSSSAPWLQFPEHLDIPAATLWPIFRIYVLLNVAVCSDVE